MAPSRYSTMMHDHFVSRVRRIMRERDDLLGQICSNAAAEEYIGSVRAKLSKIFSPPSERTSLNAEFVSDKKLDGCILERVHFESRPGFPVTCNVFRPDGPGRHPCALILCGHSNNGKAYSNYQKMAFSLARKGFVSMIADPIEQGERRQFASMEYQGASYDLCAWHNRIGMELSLVGEFLGTWMLWDAIRSLDYLLSRNDVDDRHIGVAGCSGGGTMTSYLAAIDPRPTMFAPVCYLSSFLSNLERQVASDIEQSPPGILEAGLDQADFFIAGAPRHLLILAEKNDFFDLKATEKTYLELKKIYSLVGAGASVNMSVGHLGHGLHRHARESISRFFIENAGLIVDASEPEFDPLSEEDCNVLECGGRHIPGRKNILILSEEMKRVLKKRRIPSTKAELATELEGLLKIRYSNAVPRFEVLKDSSPENGADIDELSLETDEGIHSILSVSRKSGRDGFPSAGKVLLFVASGDEKTDATGVKSLSSIAGRNTWDFAAIYPRGTGKTYGSSYGAKAFLHPYGSNFMYASYSDMLGESYAGKRVWDVLMGANLLFERGVSQIYMIGSWRVAPLCLFAALLHPRSESIRVLNWKSCLWILERQWKTRDYASIPRSVLCLSDLAGLCGFLRK